MVAGNLHPLVKLNLVLLLFFLIFGGLYLASDFLIPLAFAGIFAMLMSPLSAKLEGIGFNKALASFVCILLLVLVFTGIGTLLSTQIAGFTEDLPQIEQEINKQLISLQGFFHETFGISPEEQQKIVKEGSSSESGGLSSIILSFIDSSTGAMANALLVLVYMFLLLYYRSRFPIFILKVVSEDQEERAQHVIQESSQVAQKYLIGRGILIVILAVLYSAGLTIAGLDNALFLSAIAALLTIIPYVGNIIGFSLLMLMALAQGEGSQMYLSILIIFSIVQLIESYVLEPFVVGAEVDIHPFFTVVIIIVGEQIWGVAGMILAIPMLAIVKIIFSHIDFMSPYAYLIGDTRDKKRSRASDKIKNWFSHT